MTTSNTSYKALMKIKATVLGRAEKATGRNKGWYNIQEEISNEKKKCKLRPNTMGTDN